MSRLTRDGTAELVSRGQIIRRKLGQLPVQLTTSRMGKQPYLVDSFSAMICDDYTVVVVLGMNSDLKGGTTLARFHAILSESGHGRKKKCLF